VILLLWVLALPVLLAGLGTPVVQRTQEARVLETGREMLASTGWRQWMVPKLNGEQRLQKPPLAYWAAAGGFKLFGINDFAGRLPFALAGWLTLAVVYLFGRDLNGARFGLLSAAVLLTSFMFFRHFRLAETDSLVAFFVAAGMYTLWKGGVAATEKRGTAWFHLAGLSIGLAVMAKGPPAVFPVLFFVAWVAVERRGRAIVRLLLSGAALTALIVGGAWFLYIYQAGQFRVLREELFVIAHGEDHVRPFHMYLPLLFLITAPWTGLFTVGLVEAARGWRRSEAARVALLWLGVVLVPLCFMGNKQNHYLVPLTPAMAMVTAYAVHRGLGADPAERRAAGWVIALTLVAALASPAAVMYAARHERGGVQHLDLALCLILLAGTVAAISLGRRNGTLAAVFGMIALVAVTFAVTFGRWLPSLEPVNHRTVAAELRARYGDVSFAYIGPNESMPLVWNLRNIIRETPTREELDQVLRIAPDTVVIAQVKNNKEPPPLPPQLIERARLAGMEGNVLRIYRANPN